MSIQVALQRSLSSTIHVADQRVTRRLNRHGGDQGHRADGLDTSVEGSLLAGIHGMDLLMLPTVLRNAFGFDPGAFTQRRGLPPASRSEKQGAATCG
jgi:hypothetical protein